MGDVDEALRELHRARRAPLRIRVCGHPGVGVRTLAAALVTRFRVDARCGPLRDGCEQSGEDPAGDDLICQVLGAGVRGCDLRALARYRIPVLVVAGRADQRGGQVRAAALAGQAAARLGRPVYPVAALPGGARVDGDDLALLRGWAGAGVRVPALPAGFVDVAAGAERRRRAGLLHRYGPDGLSRLLAALAGPGGAELDAAAATGLLRAAGGLEQLVAPLHALGPAVRRRRDARFAAELSALAAAGPGRDRIELLAQRAGRE